MSDVLAAVSGFGPLQSLLDDPEIEEIWLNGPESIHVARGGVAERIEMRLTESSLRDLIERMLQSTGRRVDISQPFVDASLPDGSRLHVAIADTGGVACCEVHYSAGGRLCHLSMSQLGGRHPRSARGSAIVSAASWTVRRRQTPLGRR
ncbi:ATPase, T2SS/T4P/T4SS family [Microbacterium sp. 1.5R]|uniref:ATPase, T2SS/T4P/T4SS family n=1 Tax=Microbacterium sp. 1.5R TaxID=1916917 RepID=UPI001E307C19|nr:ATPase, T2SS/T4P/T4SS family [Microbacterium sp. 1.5R]